LSGYTSRPSNRYVRPVVVNRTDMPIGMAQY
jgi:hypothetical protein